ncbi:MAG: glycerol-3-phosphate 1-O-acyltransferase PlsY [Steroidobacteraceae bacterium]|jgi:glycerol-3-phosphate acyltransferase PlsY
MLAFALCLLAAYLLGSINGSLALGRLRGVDIRTQGSGNAGGTNALRTQGPLFALGVIVIDVGKAWIAVRLLPDVFASSASDSAALAWLACGCGAAAVLGHVYPVFHGFRGGKGVATLLGTLLALSPTLLLGVLGLWLVMMVLFGFVGLGSMVASAGLPVMTWFAGREGWIDPEWVMPLMVFGVVSAPFVIWTHRTNIARMRAGTEPRAHRLWLLGRWLA